MNDYNYEFLPEITTEDFLDNKNNIINKIIVDSPCPCCGSITIPNKGDAIAYICPICIWEIDPFITDDNEPSDLNHGLSLIQARKNYLKFSSIQKHKK